MKKPNTLVAASAVTLLAGALLGPVAHAQSSNFKGLSVGLGVASTEAKVEDSYPSFSSQINNTDTNGVLQVQYSLAAGNSFLVGLGGSISLGNLKAGSFGTNAITLKDGYSLYVAPGYAINDTWMGYAKVAYLNANLQNSFGNTLNYDNGYGLGLGAQVMFNKNWFGQVEYMANRYADRSPYPGETIKLKTNVYALTAGYRF